MKINPSTARRIAVVIALTAAAVAFIWVYAARRDFFDLRIYVSAMHWWADGHPLYDYAQPDRVQGELYFTYPPFAALLLRPFALVPVGFTIGFFCVFTVAAVAVAAWWLTAPVADRRGLPRWLLAGLLFPVALAVEPSRETFFFGQINMVLVLLILADFCHAVPRKWFWAGAGVGLATAIKLFPGIFILYFLVTRRWREAAVSAGTAVVATLLAAAVAPHDSWQFWTSSLFSTERVGRTDYTGNQSLQGLLARLVAPDEPAKIWWLLLALAVTGFGMWRAARAFRAGDDLSGLTLTGLVGALVSPITWPHHVFWFVPALVVLVDSGRRRDLALAGGTLAVALYGVNTFIDWGIDPVPTRSVGDFLLRNLYVLAALALVALLPARSPAPDTPRIGQT
ncbi:polyprenol-phosphate-mannose-dependent alpha-(1-2)-phosphatidylinositol mannoside mannosyltransferase [Asanoa ishikariensis]|uniref:Alpha-1,2-mannosyltransferase n=1 Tax=Asanoa ishikariensis TaxID=137265 RepID=A0A1H3MVT6_9ACTN|nr:glycosyltransferase 87 family protein [Asanoa ishikariensis]GIF66350.1 polyprenol-phosphate-mannose-dependent alpha-(1-2)-phosphatidylinositol mannoside mannosyltransferase [Asanoa ishikariensis]SDY80315.1 alpha-1,2-mannosyltransferase [Asanoa ishikariensis]